MRAKSELTEVEQRFVSEFLVDRDPFMAARRTGVASVVIKRQVKKWMEDSRIVRAIQGQTDGMDVEKMISPQRIVAGFMDVAFDRTANHSARNTALRELAALKKMYDDPDDGENGSGVIYIPVAGTLEDWKALSLEAQRKLKESVRE